MTADPSTEAGLRTRWRSLSGAGTRIGVGLGEELLARWAEPQRHHHDQRHLLEVLNALEVLSGTEVRSGAETVAGDIPLEVVLAAWFHDAVYDPTRTDNEARSAGLAQDRLGLSLPADTVAEVVRLVLLTRTHEVASDDRRGALLSDADLAVLAAEPARYDRYVLDVRREYAHVPPERFGPGRAAVLTDLLAHRTLYWTTAGRSWWEARARRNIEAELAVSRPLS